MINTWAPQAGPQAEAITATWCDELFFGGARGGGKSDFLLNDFAQDINRYGKHWQGILFRKSYPELSGLVQRSHSLWSQSGAEWKEAKHQWQFPNGAILRFRHLERDLDAGRYQGHQYPWIGFDELTNWASPTAYDMLKACRRWADAELPTKRVRASGNPGGAGHQWVKSRFIDPAPAGFHPMQDEESKWWRMFIPSKVSDNRILLQNDPNYINTLRGIGSKELVRSWLEGDWSVITGAYFDTFETTRNGKPWHVIPPFEIPEYWTRFTAYDHGFASPFCNLWVAVSDGTMPHIPKNALVVYREVYGAVGPNEGMRLTMRGIADMIRAHELPDEKIEYRRADPSIFKNEGGPTIAEEFSRFNVHFLKADNNRPAGWQQVRLRLEEYEGAPLLQIFSTCKHLIRTLPALQHDPVKAEDLDTTGEDHAADALRYGLMSRPYFRAAPRQQEPIRGIERASLEELWKTQPTKKRVW
jgi:hypothetical protein